MSYINEKFLLNTKFALDLYNNYAKNEPIFDYHCHLSEKEILEDKRIDNAFDLWISKDHYKWRLMRNFGIDENFITGNASKKEKFIKYCETIGTAFGNPLYHWSQLEIKKYFDCDLEINKENAEKIWDICNKYLEDNVVSPSTLIVDSNVKYIFTTNGITDDLTVFEKINAKKLGFEVYPSFRCDVLMEIQRDGFVDFIKNANISTFEGLEEFLISQLDKFQKVGSRIADISLEYVPFPSERENAKKIFDKRINGAVAIEEADTFRGYFVYFLMKCLAEKKMACELHIGPTRNNNQKMFEKLGADSGYDAISDKLTTENLQKLFDKLDSINKLPKTILFNLNPNFNQTFVTLMGAFQDSEVRGKIQYGPAWWFLDNKPGMEKQLLDLSAGGHIRSFIGMLTDSRSLLSYERHQYFRRILCNFLGTMMENGEVTQNIEVVGEVVKDICFANASKYFKM